jgi:AcrR family transcriptional regulator
MPSSALSREQIVERLLAVFREHGYEGASLSRISQATGLGRSSLYHHFPRGKEDMAEAVLAHVEAWMGEHVIAPLAGAGTARECLARFVQALDDYYAGGRRACLIDVFGVGEARALFRSTLAGRVTQTVAALAGLLERAGVAHGEAERRAEGAMVAIEGALVVSRALGSNDPFHRMLRELPERLLAGV